MFLVHWKLIDFSRLQPKTQARVLSFTFNFPKFPFLLTKQFWKKKRDSNHLQKPVDRNDEADVISGQSHRCQHDDHSDQPCLRDSSCSNTGGRSCDTDGGDTGIPNHDFFLCFLTWEQSERVEFTDHPHFSMTKEAILQRNLVSSVAYDEKVQNVCT